MDSSNLQAYLRKVYPERQELLVCNFKDITAGWETEICSFDLEWNLSDETYTVPLVARIYPGNYSRTKAEKEFKFMQELRSLQFPVPIVHILETDESLFGCPFIIMDRIDGGTLEDQIQQSKEKRSELLDMMCELFVRLHQIPWESLTTRSTQEKAGDPFYFIRYTLSNYRSTLRRTKGEILLPIVDWLDRHSETVPCTKPSVVHGDFHPMNIILDNNENPVVIDWGAAQVNDFRIDLGWTLLLYMAYGSMEHRNDLLNRYESALGHSVEQIEYFEIIACLRRLHDIFISITQGGEEKGLRPEVSEMILSSIQHVIKVRNRLKILTGISIQEIDEMLDSAD